MEEAETAEEVKVGEEETGAAAREVRAATGWGTAIEQPEGSGRPQGMELGMELEMELGMELGTAGLGEGTELGWEGCQRQEAAARVWGGTSLRVHTSVEVWEPLSGPQGWPRPLGRGQRRSNCCCYVTGRLICAPNRNSTSLLFKNTAPLPVASYTLPTPGQLPLAHPGHSLPFLRPDCTLSFPHPVHTCWAALVHVLDAVQVVLQGLSIPGVAL